MATSNKYDYRYYIEGRYIALLQRSTDSVYDPYLNLSEDLFTTPSVADTDAIYYRYTKLPTAPTAETSTIDLGKMLSLALVEYVKARLAEDAGDDRSALKHMKKFYYYIGRDQDNKKGAVRMIMPSGAGVCK